ncbi:MAG: IS4 family transposase [archaeon]
MKDNRRSYKDFTRKRKMPFTSLIIFMMNAVKQTLQKELTNFMEIIYNKRENITKSAFCQSRMKLKPEAFVELNDVLVHEFYTDNDELRWKGFRLIAIDGSLIQLPNSEEIISNFGCLKNQFGDGMPSARISTCYDILNEIVIDTQINNCKVHEYDLALEHLEKLKQKDLFIYDRNYGGIWFMYKHHVGNRDFVIRMKRTSIKEIDSFFESKEKEKTLKINKLSEKSKKRLKELGIEFKPFEIRIVKVILDNGEVEVLATSLTNKEKYPTEILKDLYFKRWGVETNYDHLKNNLQLEDFTGLSFISVKQDLFASMFIINLQSIIIDDLKEELKNKKSKKDYMYKINRNLSLGFMKDRVVSLFFDKTKDTFEELRELFKMELVPVRPNRKNERVEKLSRRKFHMNKKRAI